MPRRFNERYSATGVTALTQEFWNRVISDIDARVAEQEGQGDRVDAAIESVNKTALDRIDSVLTPAIESILRVQEKGFLLASSATELTLDDGDIVTFVVPEGDERDLFTPSAFVAITRTATYEDYAFGRVIGWARAYGELTVEIIDVTGDPGPHSDWQIMAGSGVTAAVAAMMDVVVAARDTATGAADTASAKADQATGAAQTATDKAGEARQYRDQAESFAEAAEQFDPALYVAKNQNLADLTDADASRGNIGAASAAVSDRMAVHWFFGG